MVGTFHAAGGSRAYELLNPPVRWLRQRLDASFAVSEDAAAMAGGALGGEFEVLFNGVEIDRCAQADPWPTDGPTVLFVGRHEPRKGLAVLLEALQQMPDDVRLWVVGDGPETVELEQRMAGDSRIDWLGRIDEQEKLSRMRGADVFCAPSLRGESFGVVLLEAMAAGTPVVACDIAGYARVARSDREAVLVPPGDASALAAALEKVLGDPGLSDDLVANGLARAEEFSMRRLADRYLEAYEGVVA
jgi:phosphatidylinositol alpha-mannosyltransferase